MSNFNYIEMLMLPAEHFHVSEQNPNLTNETAQKSPQILFYACNSNCDKATFNGWNPLVNCNVYFPTIECGL